MEILSKEVDEVIESHDDNLKVRNCLVCDLEIESTFKLECKCDICKKCIYNWVVEKNFPILFKDLDITCPNHNCRKDIKLEWLYTNLKSSQVSVINEILFKKYSVRCKDISKCPRNDCNYIGFTNGIKCRNEFKCEVCLESWYDPDLRIISTFDKVIDFFLRIRLYIILLITELTILVTCTPCKFCGFIIYRYEGCKHITCSKCNGQFCEYCFSDWLNNHDEEKCNYKVESLIIIIIFFIFLIIMKFLLSFYYLRISLFFILDTLLYELLIGIYLVGLCMPMLLRFIYLKGVVCAKDVKIKINIIAITATILIEYIHIYLSYKWEFIAIMNKYIIYELIIAISVISLYFVIKGWLDLIKNMIDEIR